MGAFFFTIDSSATNIAYSLIINKMKIEIGFVWKLGMFVILGFLLFVFTIYFVGKQKNLFGGTFILHAQFNNVSGLKVGNNVRFAGINVGTVDNIELINDTSVLVDLIVKDEIHPFIKTDANGAIGSDGLMGDKVLTIYPGNSLSHPINNNGFIASRNAIEVADVMRSLKISLDNAQIITKQLAESTYKINNGKGALSKLITDEDFSKSLKGTLTNVEISSNEFAKFTIKMNNGKGALSKLVSDERLGNKIDSTISNLETGTKGLSENMEAAKSNIFLRGFFNNKKNVEAKRLADLKKKEELKMKKALQNSKDSTIK